MVEQPVVEEPVVEQPVVEEPVVEQPVVEEPVVEQPVVEEPVVEQPVAEQPVVEEPVVEQPVVEEPVVEQPVVEEPVVEQPVVEEPVVEEPVVIPLATLQAGVSLYNNEAATEAVGKLAEKAVVLVLEEKNEVSKVQYAVKEEGSGTELKVAFAKKADLTPFTAEDLASWNNASHANGKEAQGYILDPVKFEKVAVEKKEAEKAPAAEEKAPAVKEAEKASAAEEKAPAVKEADKAPAAEEKAPAVKEAVQAPAVVEEAPVVKEEAAQEKEPTPVVEAAAETAPVDKTPVSEEIVEGVASLGAASTAVVVPDGGDVLASAEYALPTDVLAAVGASSDYTITDDGVITQYNGNDTVIIIPNQVMKNGVAKQVTAVSNTAFSRNTTITSITMPTTVDYVDIGGFKGCTSLRVINLPNNINYISDEAFSGCTSLETIAWSDGIYHIGAYAFDGCTSLKGVALPSSVYSISRYAFNGCTSLSTITWPNGLGEIDEYAFAGCTSLTGLSLPASLEWIGNYAFSGCTGILDANMQNGLLGIGTGAFAGCTALRAINIPDTVYEMGNSAFENCSAAASLSLSTACTDIKNFTFKGCRSLTRLTIPNGVKTIGREAFEGCSNLSLVYTIPASVVDIGNYAFANCASGCFFFVENPNVVLGTDCLGTNTNIFGYKPSTAQTYANAHSGVNFYSYAIVNYVNRCYQLIHNRASDAEGLIYWATGLAKQQFTAAEVVARFINSKEFTARKVNNSDTVEILYKVMQNRSSDPAGKAYWLGCLDAGMSINYVMGGFARSTEFTNVCNNYGVARGDITTYENRDKNKNITAFVKRCYNYIHGREFDVGGMNYWTGLLLEGETDGANLVRSFVNSTEFRSRNLSYEDQVEILYLTMQNRASDAAGKAYWVGMMKSGMSIEAVIDGFAKSPEFKLICSRYGINPGRITNLQSRDVNRKVTEFVNRVYTQALSRVGEAEGLNYWTGRILNGVNTPVEVAKQFLQSYEFQYRGLDNTDFVKTLYRLYMGREYDSVGLNYWLGKLAEGWSRESIMDMFGSSPEFTKIVNSYGLN